MATSLSEQLQRLAVPQTTALSDGRRKASILFDPKEAATKDRRTIYELGLSGLQVLMTLNPNFQQFEATLFEEATLHVQRAVEQNAVNELLDANIQKFLQHLSPYFLLRPAHMCLEWLLRRFQVNEYNQSAILALTLPYHETNAFVKVLQTIRLRPSDKAWAWLRPLQKPGVPLPKSVILNRAASDPAFLAFVCVSTLDAVQELGSRAHVLQAQINFYASIVVGALENTSSIEEWHVSTLLPSLLRGLVSETVDFVSAAYIIAAQLVARTQLTPKLCNALIKNVAAVSFEPLRHTAVLLLICIFDSQASAMPKFSDKTLHILVGHEWLTTILATLSKDNVAVDSLCVPLLQGAVGAIQRGSASEVEIYKLFLEDLLCNVEFSTSIAQQLISCFLDSFIAPSPIETTSQPKLIDSFVIEIDSDDDMSSVGSDFQSWYSGYLHKLERKYPAAFDLTIKEALRTQAKKSSDCQKAIKMALGFRLKSFDDNATSIYESLYHHTVNVRVHGIQTLLANLSDYQARPQNYHLLKECIVDRISDDSELVVTEALKLPSSDFVEILGCEKFIEALLGIFNKCQMDAAHWAQLKPRVVKHLTSEVMDNTNPNIILLALMPLLFPDDSSRSTIEGITEILRSTLPDKITFLKDLKLDVKEFSAVKFKRQFLNVIMSMDKPTATELVKSAQLHGDAFFKLPMHLTHFLILLTGSLNRVVSSVDSLQVFNQIRNYSKGFKIKNVNKHNSLVSKQDFIPLQLFSDFIISLTRCTTFGNLLSWEQPDVDMHCFLSMLNFIASTIFEQKHSEERDEWIEILEQFIDTVFETSEGKMDFLTNFYIYSEFSCMENYPSLRLVAFELLNGVLKSEVTLCTAHILKISIALNSKSEITRLQALETFRKIQACEGLEDTMNYFSECVLESSYEIGMDNEQFPLVLFTILKPMKKQKLHLGMKVLSELLSIINDENALINATFTTEILRMLKHVNDEQILGALMPLASKALDRSSSDGAVHVLKSPYSDIYKLVCDRFDYQIIYSVLNDIPSTWAFIEKLFSKHDVFLAAEGKLQPVPCVVFEVLDQRTYHQMPEKYKLDLIKLTVRALAAAENDTIFLAANKLFKKCLLECETFVGMLESMFKKSNETATPQKSAKRKSSNAPVPVNTAAWKEGVVLMELLENKKYLIGVEKLIPVLFELLKVCLEADEQGVVEYTKQLTLSLLFHCCKESKEININLQELYPKSTFRIDQVVQCVRATQNPQTQHNALMLLSHCAALFPQQVLHNIVDIFTFMGSSVVRHDDAFSFHIIENIIESIIPILVKGKCAPLKHAESLNLLVIPVLKVFSDIMIDVPEHRRLPLYTKLMATLGSELYLWTFLCVVFDSQIIDDDKQRLARKSNNTSTRAHTADKISKRIEIALELTNTFTPKIILETCIQLMHYITHLPLNKDDAQKNSTKKLLAPAETTEATLFDIKCRSDRQLRHYKYLIMQFLSTISNSAEFLGKIALLSDAQQLVMKPFYQNFIIKALSYVPIVNVAIEKSKEPSQTKFWKIILHHLHDVLDNAISLLSPDMFLVVVNGLMQHQLLCIRKKVIELLISKLQQKDSYFDECNEQNFHNLFKPLGDVVNSILQRDDYAMTLPNLSNELVFIQQNALIAIKLLSKKFALKYIDDFKALLVNLNNITKKRTSISKIILSTVILTMIEISSNLKAHSLAQLPKFMPQLIYVLQDQAELMHQQSPDNVCIAIITGIQKLLESLPLFLGPYIMDIITSLSSISTRIVAQNNEKDQRPAFAIQKISTIWAKIAADVPVRILVPSCEKAYNKLMDSKSYADIGMLMKLLLQSINNTSNADLSAVQNELSNFFLHALEFRLHLKHTKYELERIDGTEASIIETFVAWILKLSESSFRPLYHKVYDWALKRTTHKESALTYFRLTNKIAEALKSLFVLFAADFIDDAAKLLNENNSTKSVVELDSEPISIELLKSILSTLNTVFLHDSKGFINSTRFEVLLQPIADQLENGLVLENDSVQPILSSCISQLAVSISNDVLWKQLNHQVLLKTRTNIPEVRILSFNCCVEIARKLGEDFTPLLPETVPFIAELFEDENPRVERNTRKSVQELEGILGESLQKYL